MPFGWQIALEKIQALCCSVALRRVDGAAFVSDGGNFIADCTFSEIADARGLQERLKRITGVVETGLFVGLAEQAILGTDDGVTLLTRSS